MNSEQPSNQVKNQKITTLVFVVIYIFVVFTSVSYAVYRYYDLTHFRDLGFFLEFPVKILDPELTKLYNFTPGGKNFLGLTGSEGEYGFHKTVHFSPIKYSYILIYNFFPSPIALFAYFSSLFFLPILYLPLIHSGKNKLETALLIGFVLLFVTAPNILHSSTGEIRPRILYSAFIPLAFLAIHYKRPQFERVLFFIGLLAIREEGIVFGLILIIYSLIHLSEDEGRKKTLQIFGFIYVINLAVVYWYFFVFSNLTYSEEDSIIALLSGRPTLMTGFVIAGIIYAGITIVSWRMSTANKTYRLGDKFELNKLAPKLLSVFVFSAFFFPLTVTGFSEVLKSKPDEKTITIISETVRHLFTHYSFSIIYIFLLILFVLIWDGVASQKNKKLLLLFLAIGLVFSLFFFVQAHPNLLEYYRANPKEQPINILLDLRERTDPYETSILVGYQVYNVFYDYNNVYIYQQLPVDIARGLRRLFPKNTELLTELIDNEIDYIAINKTDLIHLQPIINVSQIEVSVVGENERVIVYGIDR
jgi:hypothetical protein